VSLRRLFLAALAALACTSAEPPPPAPEHAPVELIPTPVEPVPEAPPASLAASTLPWVWYHTYPAQLADAFSQVGAGPIAYEHRVGDRRRYTVRHDDQDIELVLERLPEPDAEGEPVVAWRRRITTTEVWSDPVVQTSMGTPSQVTVALRSFEGYERHTFADDGTPRASVLVPDPPGFNSLAASLQLGGTSERPVVYVRGLGNAYLDELDPTSGEPIARARFGQEVLHERFRWPPVGPRGARFGHRWPAEGGGDHRARRRGDAIELLATDPKGELRWRTTLDPKAGPWSSSAVVAEHAGCVVVVVYNGGSSGASAYVVDREHGTLRFSSSPGSIGSIGHSRYGNDVGLALFGQGIVRVYGHESGGDYLGVLDLGAGRLLGHEVWRD